MYTIGYVIFGIPLTPEMESILIKNKILAEDAGFETVYSGSSETTPAYAGVLLGEFDECADVTRIFLSKSEKHPDLITSSGIGQDFTHKKAPFCRFEPTVEEESKAIEAVRNIHESLRELNTPSIGTYIIWGTS